MPYRDLGAELRREAEHVANVRHMLNDIRRRVQGNSDMPVGLTQAPAPAARRDNFAGPGFIIGQREHRGYRSRPAISADERSPARDAGERARDRRAGARSVRARTASPARSVSSERSASGSPAPVLRGSSMLLVSRRIDLLTDQHGRLNVKRLSRYRLGPEHPR